VRILIQIAPKILISWGMAKERLWMQPERLQEQIFYDRFVLVLMLK
jgi:hypothetical protein